MNDADRAIVAAAEERDRRHHDRRYWDHDETWEVAADRRELLRIVREQEADAERYRDALEICAAADTAAPSAIEINRRNIARHALRAAEDRADDDAATEATKGRWR